MKFFPFSSIALFSACCASVLATQVPAREPLEVTPETQQAMNLHSVRVTTKTWEKRFFAVGQVGEIPENHAVLSSRAAGRVTRLFAHVGELVKKGDLVVEIESRQIGNPPPKIELRAPRDGMIIEQHVHEGEPVEPDREILDLCDLRNIDAIIPIPQFYVAHVKPGCVAWLNVPGQTTPQRAIFEHWETKANPESATIQGRFRLANPDSQLRPGMRIEASVVLATEPAVLSVPTHAIQGDAWQPVVFVRDAKGAISRAPVAIGNEQDGNTKILSGLETNEEIITQGSEFLTQIGRASGSLREVLDAAHGHAHNPDGSEISSPGEPAGHDDHDHEHEADDHHNHEENPSPWKQPLVLAPSALAVIFASLWLRARRVRNR